MSSLAILLPLLLITTVHQSTIEAEAGFASHIHPKRSPQGARRPRFCRLADGDGGLPGVPNADSRMLPVPALCTGAAQLRGRAALGTPVPLRAAAQGRGEWRALGLRGRRHGLGRAIVVDGRLTGN